ncbi:MAG TPA: alkaline phosphatase family protein [Solirubrobacteraceae bacterium]|jgi:phospholipase C
MLRRGILVLLLSALAGSIATVLLAGAASAGDFHHRHDGDRREARTATPIKHIVVIFQENVSFDHYFGTYPNAANTDGQHFTAAAGTPAVGGLAPATSTSLPSRLRHARNLLVSNPNTSLPMRLDSTSTGKAGGPGGQLTCDQDHNYSDEQQATDNGLEDHFVQSTGTDGGSLSPFGTPCNAAQVMDYYDGNTVTGLWNYAQHFAMSDNSYGVTFGPSAPGAINLASGDTGNVDTAHMVDSPPVSTSTSPNGDLTPDGQGGFSLTNDAQPYWDDCSTRDAAGLTGQNIGDLLNRAGVSWGWFEGGFRPTTSFQQALAATHATGQPTSTFTPDQFAKAGFQTSVPHSSNQGLCDAVHPVGPAVGGTGQFGFKDDYIPHHEPFQYYASTANPHHLTIPTNGGGQDTLAGLSEIGRDTQSFNNGAPQFNTPNHQYDTSDFDQLVAAVRAHQLPASALPGVTFLKAPGFEDGHGGYSDPADEQQFVTREINALMHTPDWSSTAVLINYDDSDGWYDHQSAGVQNPSQSPADNLTNTTFSGPTSGLCLSDNGDRRSLAGEQGRCGFGPRLPMILISPFARSNFVDHNLNDQASIINMVEFNWNLPAISGSADQVLANRDARKGLPFDLAGLFRFDGYRNAPLVLDPNTGQPTGSISHGRRHR